MAALSGSKTENFSFANIIKLLAPSLLLLQLIVTYRMGMGDTKHSVAAFAMERKKMEKVNQSF